MEEIKNVEWNDPNERKQVIFTIGERKVTMDEEEYNTHIMSGNNNPVLIGDTLYMVSDSDYQLLKSIEDMMKYVGVNTLPREMEGYQTVLRYLNTLK